jgi:hypothetical protein
LTAIIPKLILELSDCLCGNIGELETSDARLNVQLEMPPILLDGAALQAIGLGGSNLTRASKSNRWASARRDMDPGPHVNLDLGFMGTRLSLGRKRLDMTIALPISVIHYPRLAALALGGNPRSLPDSHRLSFHAGLVQAV